MAYLAAILTAIIILSRLATSSQTDDAPTAYELLKRYDFPIGLLPEGVKSYTLDEATGEFSATWDGQCSFALEGSYQLRYRRSITGRISRDRLSNLSGVSVKILFLWLNIVEVVRRGDGILFSVGIASASFPIDSFYVCPQCGCGFDCDNGGGIRNLKLKVDSTPNPSL